MTSLDIPLFAEPVGWEHSPVNPGGQLFLALEEPGWPQVFAGSSLLSGDCDVEALRESLIEAAVSRPVLTAHLAAVGSPAAQRLVWRHRNEPLEVEVLDRRGEPVPEGPPEEWLQDFDIGGDIWEPDLTFQAPVRVRLTSLSGDLTVFSLWGHHAIGDASVFFLFQLDANRRYHKRIHGTEPEWGILLSLHSSMMGTGEAEAAPLPDFVREVLHQERRYPRKSVSQVLGTRGAARPISSCRLVSDEAATTVVKSRARELGGSVTDLAVASAKLEIAEWNRSFGNRTGVQRHAVAVNQRGRSAALSDASLQNELSMVFINTLPPDWQDPVGLFESVARQRRAGLDSGFDLWMSRVGDGLAKGLTALPLRPRRDFFRRFLTPDQTLLVSNAGVPFPEIIDGQFTGRSATQLVGNVEVVAFTFTADTSRNAPNLLALMSLPRGLQLTLAGNEANLTASELSRLTDHIVNRMLNYPD